jgi:hypothetical protein
VTFGFVDRGRCSVGLVGAQDSTLSLDSSSFGFGWAPSRLLPFCCPPLGRRFMPSAKTAALHGKRHSAGSAEGVTPYRRSGPGLQAKSC